jgi:hypothetical protein
MIGPLLRRSRGDTVVDNTASARHAGRVPGEGSWATTSAALEDYEHRVAPARQRFANSSGMLALQSRADAQFLHAFLLHFSALGARMTEPVEGWIRSASARCAALGLSAMARFLAAHAHAEAGHHLMMIEDVRALAELWNRHHRPSFDAKDLLSQTPSPGVARYSKVHDDNLGSATPYAQIAIEYEIEMLPLRFGEAFIARCVELLGPDILSCLSFVTSHIRLDVAHTKSNAWAMAEVSKIPGSVPALAAAGSAILDAYAEYLADCVSLAERTSRNARSLTVATHTPVLDWRLCPPPPEGHLQGHELPAWLKEVRALRGLVLFDNGARPHFKGNNGEFSDDDPIDLYAHHILAYHGSTLVGCSRVYHLVTGPSCLAEMLLGERLFATMLRGHGVKRWDAVEIGRWIVHPAYRSGGRPAVRLAAGAAALALRLGDGSVAEHGIVVCAVGTRDRQDLMLRRIGLINAADLESIECERYRDRLQVLYCTDPRKLDRRFRLLMDQMAEILGLAGKGADGAASVASAANAEVLRQVE